MSDEWSGEEGSELRPERLGGSSRLRLVQFGTALHAEEGVAKDRTWQLARGSHGAGRVVYFSNTPAMRKFVSDLDAAIEKLMKRHGARTEGSASLLVYLVGLESLREEPDADGASKPER